MTHRNVETTIGRLVSDEDLRALFRNNPREAIAKLRREGLELSAVETDALASLDTDQLARLAKSLDPRLQRASLVPKRRERLGPGVVYILIHLASGCATAEPFDAARAPALHWQSERVATPVLPSGAADADDRFANPLSPASTLGWHKETAGRAESVRFLQWPSRSRERGEP